MAEPIYTLVVLSLTTTLLLSLWRKGSALVPYMRFLCTLVLLLALLSPLGAVLSRLWNGGITLLPESEISGNGSGQYVEGVIALAGKEICTALAALLKARTGVPISDDDIVLTMAFEEDGAVSVTAVTLTLRDRSHRIVLEKLRILTEETLLCPCTVKEVYDE